MKDRTNGFALRVLELVDSIPDSRSGRILANQLGRAGTSVGANYRAACRARSTAEMISKISIVEEEADESGFWLELLAARQVLPAEEVAPLHREAGELTAIMVASRRTMQRRLAPKSKIENPKSKIQ